MVAGYLCQKSMGLVQLKQACDRNLYSVATLNVSNLTIIVKMQYLFSTTLCHTTNTLICAFIVRFVLALDACEFPLIL